MDIFYDVIIAGGGPAGLSAALMLGRCCRRVLVCDSGRYRNAATEAVHGFLSRDGVRPDELRAIAREQLAGYDVEIRQATIREADRVDGGFRVILADSSEVRGRRLLLATGMEDHLPDLEGIHEFYGKSIHHCPYCDAWEHRSQPMAAYGKIRSAYGLALSLKTWTGDVMLVTNGPAKFSKTQRETMDTLGITLRTEPVLRLEGSGGQLESIVFATGEPAACRAIFFESAPKQGCALGGSMGCAFTHRGAIQTDKFERTSIPGVFAAGDCSRNVQWVAVAVAQGAIAAEQINIELQAEDREKILQMRSTSP